MKRDVNEHSRSKLNKFTIFGLIALALIGVFCISMWVSYHVITVTHYRVSSDRISSAIRIVMISDLHDHIFGNDNGTLIQKIRAQEPDLIVLNGDMINEDSADSDVVMELLSGLTGIAPIYYSLGNHEIAFMENGHPGFLEELENAGAIVLNQKVVDLEIIGNRLQLGGIYEYAFHTPMQDELDNERAVAYMEQYTAEADPDEYTLICAHRPESLYCFGYADTLWGLDMVLSGHLHGGQVIIPFLGGLYSPLEGFFPKYDYGQYEIGNCTMIITRGLSSDKKILPRLNNSPEIAVIDLN